MLPHQELLEMFNSPTTQQHLQDCCQKQKGCEPFLYQYVPRDNPLENNAVIWQFPGNDTAWIELLVLEDVQYIPQYPS